MMVNWCCQLDKGMSRKSLRHISGMSARVFPEMIHMCLHGQSEEDPF